MVSTRPQSSSLGPLVLEAELKPSSVELDKEWKRVAHKERPRFERRGGDIAK